jgi:integrase
MRSHRRTTGVRARHSRSCAISHGQERCNCSPSYEAFVFSNRDGRKLRKTFPTLAAARAWRHDAAVSVRKGTMRAPTPTTVAEAAGLWLVGARDGSIRNRSGDEFKPSTIHGYELSLKGHVLDRFGTSRLGDVTRADVQDFADRLLAQGLDPSTIRNTLMPLRAIYRRALSRGEVAINPTTGLTLAAVRGRRERIASREEAAALIVALPVEEQAVWATAFYAGLRRGELMALAWENIDLNAGTIHVTRSYDPKSRCFVSPKSRAGSRRVPIAALLREHLISHRLRCGRSSGLVFGPDGTQVVSYSAMRDRAARAWGTTCVCGHLADKHDDVPCDAFRPLQRIGLHEARHTFASLMIAARVNVKALSTYMGHSGISITLDRYGHLMPGNEKEAAGLLDTYLAATSA